MTSHKRDMPRPLAIVPPDLTAARVHRHSQRSIPGDRSLSLADPTAVSCPHTKDRPPHPLLVPWSSPNSPGMDPGNLATDDGPGDGGDSLPDDLAAVLDEIDGITAYWHEQTVTKTLVLLGPVYKSLGIEIPGTVRMVPADNSNDNIGTTKETT